MKVQLKIKIIIKDKPHFVSTHLQVSWIQHICPNFVLKHNTREGEPASVSNAQLRRSQVELRLETPPGVLDR